MKHCIITSEVAGPSKTGGIGTHCFYLAKFLGQRLGHDVTVLLTFAPDFRDSAHWKDFFRRECNCRFEVLGEHPPFTEVPHKRDTLNLLSLNVHGFLRRHDFDVCHFQDYLGNGFVPAQARRCGLAYRNAIFTCTLHSSSEWLRECMRKYDDGGVNSLNRDYMERYSAERADVVISPVNYMLGWARAREWKLAEKRLVLPYLIDGVEKAPTAAVNPDHLIFFGRLETRKGVEIFLKSLYALSSKHGFYQHNLKVTFLGSANEVNGVEAVRFIKGWMSGIPKNHTWEWKTNLNHFDALVYLRQNAGALVVIPSLLDNSPYTVIESLEAGFNVIAANVGGIPELMGCPERLFEPSPESLAAKIAQIRQNGLPPLTGQNYSRPAAEEKWTAFAGELEKEAALRRGKAAPPARPAPKVTVIMPHYNLGAYLPDALDSLVQQTFTDFEAIIIDDGSTDEASRRIFEKMQAQPARPNWSFIRKENGGLGQTRNFGAAKSKADYLVFMDCDNVAEPHMLETMVNSIEHSGADCLTCLYRGFVDLPGGGREYKWFYIPAGANLELGFFENLYGDANFIVRRSVFEQLGGFCEDRQTATHDWLFLARLVMAGHRMDAIPELMLQYRIRPDSMLNTSDRYYSHLKSIEPYLAQMPLWQRRVGLLALGLERQNTALKEQMHLLYNDLARYYKWSLLRPWECLGKWLGGSKD